VSVHRREGERGVSWEVRLRGPDGRERARFFKTRREASAWEREQRHALGRGAWSDPALARRTFDHWAAAWTSATVHLAPNTRRGYENVLRVHLLPRFSGHRVSTIDRVAVRALVSDLLASGASPGTVRGVRKILRLILGTAVEAGALAVNPCDGVKVPRSPRDEMVFLRHDQVLDLAHEITFPPRPRSHPAKEWPSYGLLVRFAAYTGLRAGEVAALRVERLDVLRRRVLVSESLSEVAGHGIVIRSPKNGQTRTVPIPSSVCDELAAHIAAGGLRPSEHLFQAPEGGPLRHQSFYNRHYRPAVARADVPDRTRFHDLRHTCAAFLIAEGAHPLVVKERLGHSSITVTMDRYGHLFPELDEAVTTRLDGAIESSIAARQTAQPGRGSVRSLHTGT
jgi:integrase